MEVFFAVFKNPLAFGVSNTHLNNFLSKLERKLLY